MYLKDLNTSFTTSVRRVVVTVLYVTHASSLQCSCTFVLAEANDSLEPNHQSSTTNLRPASEGCCCLVLPSLWDHIADPKLCNRLTHHWVKTYQPFQYLPIQNALLLPLFCFHVSLSKGSYDFQISVEWRLMSYVIKFWTRICRINFTVVWIVSEDSTLDQPMNCVSWPLCMCVRVCLFV